jgi:hypothetical protein
MWRVEVAKGPYGIPGLTPSGYLPYARIPDGSLVGVGPSKQHSVAETPKRAKPGGWRVQECLCREVLQSELSMIWNVFFFSLLQLCNG